MTTYLEQNHGRDTTAWIESRKWQNLPNGHTIRSRKPRAPRWVLFIILRITEINYIAFLVSNLTESDPIGKLEQIMRNFFLLRLSHSSPGARLINFCFDSFFFPFEFLKKLWQISFREGMEYPLTTSRFSFRVSSFD